MTASSAKAGARARSHVCGAALRCDAQRNRAALVAAAHEVFAEQGLGAPMAEVARRAGVGIATLFRRFPARDDLITATFAATMSDYARAIDVAAADPDPWLGFCGYVQKVCAMQAYDRGFTDVLTRIFPNDPWFEAEDLVMMLMANAGVINATGSAAPQTSPRLVAYLLQACAAEVAQPLPPPPTPRAMYTALQRLHQKREMC
jgi:AcrR family transcriptional regulator